MAQRGQVAKETLVAKQSKYYHLSVAEHCTCEFGNNIIVEHMSNVLPLLKYFMNVSVFSTVLASLCSVTVWLNSISIMGTYSAMCISKT